MATKPRTGAERYLAKQRKDPEYNAAYDEARRRIDQVDALVRALDARREELGLSKAELARRAHIAPEAVRRLFSVDSPNPTAVTLAALADALELDLVPKARSELTTEAVQVDGDSTSGPRHGRRARVVNSPRSDAGGTAELA